MAKKKLNEGADQVIENTPALDSLKPDSNRVAGPHDFSASRSQAYARALATMGGMSDNDLNGFMATMAQVGKETSNLPGSANADANRASISAHPSAAVKEDLQKLFGEEHTPEFIEKTTTIFESALEARLIIERQEMIEKFETDLTEAYEELSTELTDKVDQYLDYAVNTWKQENEIALEQGIKQDVTEQFIEGLKKLFAESYIDIPEERVDVVAELTEQVAELESKLNSAINESIAAKKSAFDADKASELAALSEGLTDTQKEKLKVLSEQVTAISIDEFKTKVGMIKESAFAAPTKKTAKTNMIAEEVSMDPNDLNENDQPIITDEVMRAYMDTVTRTVKRS